MGKYNITIDTGTTNTRTILWNDKREIIDTQNSPVGVRNTAIDGNNEKLKAAVKNCLETLLVNAKITYDEIGWIIACGMITSNVGLVEIPHLVAPVNITDIAKATTSVLLEDVCPKPIYYITGVKNSDELISIDNFESMDIMRGEEVESYAIIDHFAKNNSMLLILPGSHTKFVAVDGNGNITGCLTSITGELISAITNNTIIADAVGRQFVQEEDYNKEMLLLGYETAKKVGLGRTCFSGRILSLFSDKRDKADIANFILGAALQNDMVAAKNSCALDIDAKTSVIIAGKNPLRQAIFDILEHDNYFREIVNFVPEKKVPLSALGAYIIAEKIKLL